MASNNSTDRARVRKAVLTVVAIATFGVLLPVPAHAGLRGCVTRAETSRLEPGQTRFTVNRRILGTTGVRLYMRVRPTGHIIEKRRYRPCGTRIADLGFSRYEIRFRDGRFYDAYWITGFADGRS